MIIPKYNTNFEVHTNKIFQSTEFYIFETYYDHVREKGQLRKVDKKYMSRACINIFSTYLTY